MTSNRKGWCQLADKPCPPQCPVPSVDNSGNPYSGCAIFRFKTQAEIDAMTASTVASNECNCDPRPGTTDHYPACPASMYRAGIDRGRAEALEEAAKVADETPLPEGWKGCDVPWSAGFRNGRSAAAARIREIKFR